MRSHLRALGASDSVTNAVDPWRTNGRLTANDLAFFDVGDRTGKLVLFAYLSYPEWFGSKTVFRVEGHRMTIEKLDLTSEGVRLREFLLTNKKGWSPTAEPPADPPAEPPGPSTRGVKRPDRIRWALAQEGWDERRLRDALGKGATGRDGAAILVYKLRADYNVNLQALANLIGCSKRTVERFRSLGRGFLSQNQPLRGAPGNDPV